MKIEKILLVGAIIAAGAYIIPKIANAQTTADKSMANVETRQEERTARVQTRWEGAKDIVSTIFKPNAGKTQTNTKNKPTTQSKTYTTIFSPKQIQDAGVKLSKPNPYTSVGYIAPTKTKPATAIKPNLKMTAMVNKLFLATIQNKNKPQVTK